ncbi:MAG: hypothetical protein LBQ66_08060 [Planctomycetaceae bacterium]|nr:hypothetical protein [Planctomycetaceae bacterium]
MVLPVRFGDPVVGLRRRYSPRKPGSRLPTLHLPTRFGVQFKLVWFYCAQRRAGHLAIPHIFFDILFFLENTE